MTDFLDTLDSTIIAWATLCAVCVVALMLLIDRWQWWKKYRALADELAKTKDAINRYAGKMRGRVEKLEREKVGG
jgi:hypothetical protein